VELHLLKLWLQACMQTQPEPVTYLFAHPSIPPAGGDSKANRSHKSEPELTEGEEVISPGATLLHLNWRQWHIGLHSAALLAFVVSLIVAFAQYSKVVGHSTRSPLQPGTPVDVHRAIGYAVIVLVVLQVCMWW
jgi:hypothetical protein